MPYSKQISELSFGKIIKLNGSLAEVIVDDEVEIDLPIIEEYHDWIANNLEDPCKLLINKKHHYSYAFEAINSIATLEKIRAMAVVVYGKPAEVATKYLISMPRSVNWNIEIFHNKEEAFSWLEKQ